MPLEDALLDCCEHKRRGTLGLVIPVHQWCFLHFRERLEVNMLGGAPLWLVSDTPKYVEPQKLDAYSREKLMKVGNKERKCPGNSEITCLLVLAEHSSDAPENILRKHFPAAKIVRVVELRDGTILEQLVGNYEAKVNKALDLIKGAELVA